MNSKDLYIAGGLVMLALLGWAGVVLFAQQIADTEAARVIEIQNGQQSSTQAGALAQMHSIAVNTTGDRTALDALLSTDVTSAATLLRGVGNKTGVTVQLSGALPETAPPASPSGPQIQAVGFTVQADGTFTALMRTAQLLETLPLASSVRRFDIERMQDPSWKGPVTWHMSVYLVVFTTSDISS